MQSFANVPVAFQPSVKLDFRALQVRRRYNHSVLVHNFRLSRYGHFCRLAPTSNMLPNRVAPNRGLLLVLVNLVVNLVRVGYTFSGRVSFLFERIQENWLMAVPT
jgi:hypothetical protein